MFASTIFSTRKLDMETSQWPSCGVRRSNEAGGNRRSGFKHEGLLRYHCVMIMTDKNRYRMFCDPGVSSGVAIGTGNFYTLYVLFGVIVNRFLLEKIWLLSSNQFILNIYMLAKCCRPLVLSGKLEFQIYTSLFSKISSLLFCNDWWSHAG